MAKSGKAFGKNHGGDGASFKNKVVQSVMYSKMVPKGKMAGKK